MLEIRLYRPGDQQGMRQLLLDSSLDWSDSAQDLQDQLTAIQERGGLIVLLWHRGELAGYGSLDPLPGLDGMYDLHGCVAKHLRRMGLGTRLFARLESDLRAIAGKMISYPVESLDSEASLFLLDRGFYIEHHEVRLQYANPAIIDPVELAAGFELRTYPLVEAVSYFRQLYDLSFRDTPWFQPYQSYHEVARELADPGDIYFLTHRRQPVGFGWLRWPKKDQAQVEPLGLVRDYQYLGLGRPFLERIMSLAAQQGATCVNIGAWQENQAALTLYQKIGFKPHSTTTFLAYKLEGESQMEQ